MDTEAKMNGVNEFEGWVTTSEGAALTGYNVNYIRNLLNSGRIEGVKVQTEWLIKKESLLAYKQEMEELGASKHDPRRRRS